MIVVKAPAGFDRTWPAIPVDPTVTSDRMLFGENMPRRTVLDLAALLGWKDADRCPGCAARCGSCADAVVMVPQRVALAIETPCETCGGQGRIGGRHYCQACDCSGVRLRVEYTAQVDAAVSLAVDLAGPEDYDDGWDGWLVDGEHDVVVQHHEGDGLWKVYVGSWLVECVPDADWSPGRVAVLISDVHPTRRPGG